MQKATKGITIRLTDRDDTDFLRLTEELVAEYVALYGEEALDFCPAGALADVVCAAVAYDGTKAAASGGLRGHDAHAAELMRVYVHPDYRRQGLGALVVRELERGAKRLGFTRTVLVTGLDMPAALALYERLGYVRTENFGPMQDDPLCVCMEKQL
ncbi:MAG: GNAT family N-acetyltransferase [Bacillota bacterium]